MKKVLIVATLLFGSFALTQKVSAQVRFGFNINIGEQPSWRAPGYNYVEYYYLPEIEAYYYVPRHQFIYVDNGRWVFSSSLPYRYRSYNLYTANKVVVNRHNAYLSFDQDRMRYGGSRYNDGYNKNGHRNNGRRWNDNRRY